jgi:hypothetical protein
MLALRLTLDLDMNLSPVDVEHAQDDRLQRPIYFANKLNRPNSVPSVGKQFGNDGRRAVEELDLILHLLSAFPDTTVRGTCDAAVVEQVDEEGRALVGQP